MDMLFFRTNCSCMLIWVFDVGCRSFFSSHIFLVPIILTKQPITIKCWRCFQRGWVVNFGTDNFMLLFRFQIIRVFVCCLVCFRRVYYVCISSDSTNTNTEMAEVASIEQQQQKIHLNTPKNGFAR